MPKDSAKSRKKLVVEEVPAETEVITPVEEIKEKVGELKEITEDIGESVEKSEEVQNDIADAATKVEEESHGQPLKAPEPPIFSKASKGVNPLLIFIPGVLLLGALLGGIYFYEKNINNIAIESPVPGPTEVPGAVSTPSPTPSAKLDLTKYPIRIENGSGVPGVAGSVKESLEAAGFKVASTGNASNYSYAETVIKTKSGVPSDFVSKLKTTLSKTYKVGDAESLPDTSKEEVVVIIGSSKAD